ncbi:MAG: isochorismatase family protein [Proteobacteria bacterium]|nr:MAG: isochorismatase family protein [Pseudomonadota bacterium]
MIETPVLFICDMQEKFVKAIHEWDHVLSTAEKLLAAADILAMPVYYTTQLRSKLGDTIPSLKSPRMKLDLDKSLFSMCLPEILESLSPGSHVAIVGIEAHICVTQTTLDLLQHGHKVFVIADGVSSCNKEEVPIALRRLATAGAVITTSESFVRVIKWQEQS